MARTDGDPRFDSRPDARLDRWVSAGRQLVDGVAGARPGSRPSSRPGAPRPGALGRWLEERMDWLLEDGDDWREPWQEREPAAAPRRRPVPEPGSVSRRRPLEAISRRGARPAAAESAAAPEGDWPDDASFRLSRWQRPAPVPRPLDDLAAPPPPPPPGGGVRPLPRSTRRRPGLA